MKLAEINLIEREDYSLGTIKSIWVEARSKCFPHLDVPGFSLEQDLTKYHKFFDVSDDPVDMLAFCDWTPQMWDQRQRPWDVDNFRPVLRFSRKIKDRETLKQIILHEMVHQWIAQNLGYVEMCNICHGEEFMKYAPIVAKFEGMELTPDVDND